MLPVTTNTVTSAASHCRHCDQVAMTRSSCCIVRDKLCNQCCRSPQTLRPGRPDQQQQLHCSPQTLRPVLPVTANTATSTAGRCKHCDQVAMTSSSSCIVIGRPSDRGSGSLPALRPSLQDAANTVTRSPRPAAAAALFTTNSATSAAGCHKLCNQCCRSPQTLQPVLQSLQKL